MAGWIPAAIGAGASLVGGKMGNRSANQAAQAQLTANREALGFERERYGRAMQNYDRDRADWQTGRDALLQRYGFNLKPQGQMSQMPQGQPMTIGSLLGAQAQPQGGPGMGASGMDPAALRAQLAQGRMNPEQALTIGRMLGR
jgi:hypothetical protein